MQAIMAAFRESLGFLRRDRPTMLLASIPVLLGFFLYALLGTWFYNTFLGMGRDFIQQRISEGSLGAFLYWILFTILSVILFFIVNWTFVLIVSLIASPFNDLLSGRVEKLVQGVRPDTLGESFKRMLGKLIKTLFNEVKKISLILILSLLAVLLSLSQILAPVGFFLSGVLLSVQFLDYSWSRNEQIYSDCVAEVKKNIFPYSISGMLFTLVMTVPVVNLLALPFAVIFFTLLRIKRRSLVS